MARGALGSRGFTFTEIMIALFLVAMFGVAIGNLEFFAHGTLRRSDSRLWLSQEPRRLLDWMGTDIEQASSVEVYLNTAADGDGWPENGGTARAVGVAGNALELTWLEDNDGTPFNRSDDIKHEIRYTWTGTASTTLDTHPPVPSPAGWDPTMREIVRRYERVTDLPAAPGPWATSDIVCGLGEDRTVGNPVPDTPVLRVTNFQVTKTADPGTSQLNPLPANVLRLVVEVSSTNSQHIQATYYLQSRALKAQRVRDLFLAFLKKRIP